MTRKQAAEILELQNKVSFLQASLERVRALNDLDQAKAIASQLVAQGYGRDRAEVLARFISLLCWVDLDPEDLRKR